MSREPAPVDTGALPIGDEPIELSIDCARRDAELRGLDLRASIEQRRATFDSRQELSAVWDPGRVHLEIEVDRTWVAAIQVARSSGKPWMLLTAMNPLGRPLPDSVNRSRVRSMAELLDLPSRSVGRAVDGTWAEEGFAVAPTRAAIDVAQRFAQAAVYVVDSDGIDVVFLVGAAPALLAEVVVDAPADSISASPRASSSAAPRS